MKEFSKQELGNDVARAHANAAWATLREHKPATHLKWSKPYENEETGETYEARLLYRLSCVCGWQGACWYANETKAREHYHKHLPPERKP